MESVVKQIEGEDGYQAFKKQLHAEAEEALYNPDSRDDVKSIIRHGMLEDDDTPLWFMLSRKTITALEQAIPSMRALVPITAKEWDKLIDFLQSPDGKDVANEIINNHVSRTLRHDMLGTYAKYKREQRTQQEKDMAQTDYISFDYDEFTDGIPDEDIDDNEYKDYINTELIPKIVQMPTFQKIAAQADKSGYIPLVSVETSTYDDESNRLFVYQEKSIEDFIRALTSINDTTDEEVELDFWDFGEDNGRLMITHSPFTHANEEEFETFYILPYDRAYEMITSDPELIAIVKKDPHGLDLLEDLIPNSEKTIQSKPSIQFEAEDIKKLIEKFTETSPNTVMANLNDFFQDINHGNFEQQSQELLSQTRYWKDREYTYPLQNKINLLDRAIQAIGNAFDTRDASICLTESLEMRERLEYWRNEYWKDIQSEVAEVLNLPAIKRFSVNSFKSLSCEYISEMLRQNERSNVELIVTNIVNGDNLPDKQLRKYEQEILAATLKDHPKLGEITPLAKQVDSCWQQFQTDCAKDNPKLAQLKVSQFKLLKAKDLTPASARAK